MIVIGKIQNVKQEYVEIQRVVIYAIIHTVDGIMMCVSNVFKDME